MENIGKNASIRLYKEDEIIIKEGECSSVMYKIISGNAALYLHYGEENEYLIGIAGEQKCFGEVSLLSGKPSPYTVVANCELMVIQIKAEQFEGFIERNTRNAAEIMRNMAGVIVMLSGNIDLIADELSDIAAQLEAGGDGKQNVSDMSKRIIQYKISAITGKSGFDFRT